jgi:hypothetical protein
MSVCPPRESSRVLAKRAAVGDSLGRADPEAALELRF